LTGEGGRDGAEEEPLKRKIARARSAKRLVETEYQPTDESEVASSFVEWRGEDRTEKMVLI
jgi:hypothetical protein